MDVSVARKVLGVVCSRGIESTISNASIALPVKCLVRKQISALTWRRESFGSAIRRPFKYERKVISARSDHTAILKLPAAQGSRMGPRGSSCSLPPSQASILPANELEIELGGVVTSLDPNLGPRTPLLSILGGSSSVGLDTAYPTKRRRHLQPSVPRIWSTR